MTMGDDLRKADEIARLFGDDDRAGRLALLMTGGHPLGELDEHPIPTGAHWTPEGPHGECWVARWNRETGTVQARRWSHEPGTGFSAEAADLPAARREVLRIAGLIADGRTRED